MQETAARETPGAGSGQLQFIETTGRDQQNITVEVEGRVTEVSVAEMEFYCDLFETMFEEIDRRESNSIYDLDGLLDEFDRAEIEHLRHRYGKPGPF